MIDAMRQQAVDRLYADYDRPASPGCALGIVRDGQVIYSHGYGMANLDHDIPNTTATAFNIGSESKQFTAACIALLMEERQLSLDQDIRRWVPAVPTFGAAVTLDHLIHHTSGIPDYHQRFTDSGLAENVYSQPQLLDYALRYERLDFAPGERCHYSNTGYLLLAVVVQQITGMPFSRFVQDHILQPLGMRNTRVHDDRHAIIPRRAFAYARRPEGGWCMNLAWNETVPGDGKMFSTIDDLALWDRNFYEPKIGRGRWAQIMLTRGRLNDGTQCNYAFGLDRGQFAPAEICGHPLVTHGGGHGSFESVIARLPDVRLSVILLCNIRDRRFRASVAEIVRIVLNGAQHA